MLGVNHLARTKLLTNQTLKDASTAAALVTQEYLRAALLREKPEGKIKLRNARNQTEAKRGSRQDDAHALLRRRNGHAQTR
jgi:hypothetical protein